MNLHRYFGWVLAAFVIGFAACGGATQRPAVIKVSSTTSFGMCAGYCKTRLEIAPDQAVLTQEGWERGEGESPPARALVIALSAQEWQEIADAAAAARIEGLPETIGCPDCADGGAESLTIESAGRSKTITFDHGAEIEEAHALLERVRTLRARLTPQELR
jgi:hypothetical protein